MCLRVFLPRWILFLLFGIAFSFLSQLASAVHEELLQIMQQTIFVTCTQISICASMLAQILVEADRRSSFRLVKRVVAQQMVALCNKIRAILDDQHVGAAFLLDRYCIVLYWIGLDWIVFDAEHISTTCLRAWRRMSQMLCVFFTSFLLTFVRCTQSHKEY